MILQIKAERSEFNDEALLEADSAAVEKPVMNKEEPFDDNVEKLQDESPALSLPFLAPTPPSGPEPESSKSSSGVLSKHKQHLYKVRDSSRASKRSISEETMAALSKMIKYPKRKPTIEEMQELVSHARSFKDPVGKAVGSKMCSPKISRL